MKKHQCLSLAIALILIVSCNKKTNDLPSQPATDTIHPPQLIVSRNNIKLGMRLGASDTFTIYSGAKWILNQPTDAAIWLNADPAKGGPGKTQVTLTVTYKDPYGIPNSTILQLQTINEASNPSLNIRVDQQ